ncbi:SAM-dependent methyltransferase [Paludibacter sp. 221]|nr:class I SAM-dependent methyltransferase [Paludibacter sp. 221]NDV46005.1 SAM-dependent methyltransferase [Paludibacter sp. 221]
MDEMMKQFITEHQNNDVRLLALQAKRYPDIDMNLAIRQISGRQKIKHKVPLFYQSDDVLYPQRLSLEQASSETTAIYKSTICEGVAFVDLTGGFGIDTFFISSKFKESVYVERQKELCQLAEYNFQVLKTQNITVVNAHAEDYLNKMSMVDCIYLDPARRSDSGKKLVFLSDCEPDVENLLPLLRQKAKHVLIKLSPMLDITTIVKSLPGISDIHIVAVENECKEVLVELNSEESGKIKVHAINFASNDNNQKFDFDLEEEDSAVAIYANKFNSYLYEPNSALMKSGAFKLIAQRLKVKKIHPHTHLYTSDEYISGFPGRTFRIKQNWGNSKKEWKEHLKNIAKANIAVRNYPLKADELRKKLKLSDGGDCYLFACTTIDERKVIIECEKV